MARASAQCEPVDRGRSAGIGRRDVVRDEEVSRDIAGCVELSDTREGESVDDGLCGSHLPDEIAALLQRWRALDLHGRRGNTLIELMCALRRHGRNGGFAPGCAWIIGRIGVPDHVEAQGGGSTLTYELDYTPLGDHALYLLRVVVRDGTVTEVSTSEVRCAASGRWLSKGEEWRPIGDGGPRGGPKVEGTGS